MDERSLRGQAKYGAMMMEEVEGKDKDLMDFLIDVQEEIMDALLYIEAAKRCLQDEVEETMLNKYENGGYDDQFGTYNIEVKDEEIL